MMKKIALIIGIFVLLFVLPTSVFGCVSFPTLKFDNRTIEFTDYTNPTSVQEELKKIAVGYEKTECNEKWCIDHGYPSECPPCPEKTETIQYNLNNAEIEIITEFIVNGYSVEEMTQEEYQVFLIRAKQINNDPKNCDLYRAIVYKGRWAAYILDRKQNQYCPVIKCPTMVFNVLWNDLATEKEQKKFQFQYLFYLILSILIILMIVLFLKIRKKK